MQRQAAASVQAEETQRRMRFMREELAKAREAVVEAEKGLRLRELELLERDKRVGGGLAPWEGGGLCFLPSWFMAGPLPAPDSPRS